jgi:hypothetical protein
MKNIRRILGNRRKANNKPEVNLAGLFKKRKSKGVKRKRWDAILDRLPNNIPLLGAEIGVLNGNTSHRILGARLLLKLYMVDPWIAPEKESSYFKSGDDNALKPAQEHDKAYRLTLKRVAFAGDRAIIMKMFSHEAEPKIEDGSLDFVFIDGDHSYIGVSKDIKSWLPKVKKGGWIGGHDYHHETRSNLQGVTIAVDEVFTKSEIEIDDNHTWFVRL